MTIIQVMFHNYSWGSGAKWNKFSPQDLSSLKNRDGLVTKVVAKYGLEKIQALRDVDALLKGRLI